MGRKKFHLLIMILLAASSSCSSDDDGFLAKLFKGGGSAVPVTVESVTTVDRDYNIKVPAVIRPSAVEEISFPRDMTIEKVFVSKGDLVEQGTPLFQISENEIKAQMLRLKDELRNTRAELEKNIYLLNNRDRLLEEERIDQAQYDSLDGEVDAGEAKVEKLQSELGTFKEKPGDSSITSPAGGLITDMLAGVGITIPAGKPLVTITKIDPATAEFDLASYEATTVHPGMAVNIKLPDLSAETLKGEITKVDSAIDSVSETFKVWATIPNGKGFLKVGMTAEVEFKTSQKQRFHLIPADALIRERRRYYVFTVINGVAHRVEVVPKEKKGDKIEIAKGLRENDLVVVKGNDKLTEGTVLDIWGK